MGFTKGDWVVTPDGSGIIVSGPDSDGDYKVDMGLHAPVLYHKDNLLVDKDYYDDALEDDFDDDFDDDLEVEFEDENWDEDTQIMRGMNAPLETQVGDQLSLFLQGGSNGPG